MKTVPKKRTIMREDADDEEFPDKSDSEDQGGEEDAAAEESASREAVPEGEDFWSLTEYNLTYKLQMPPECCGVHSDNRAGQGLIPADVHELLGMLVAGGWSWSQVHGALALELAPRESRLGQRHLQSNVQLGFLARTDRERANPWPRFHERLSSTPCPPSSGWWSAVTTPRLC